MSKQLEVTADILKALKKANDISFNHYTGSHESTEGYISIALYVTVDGERYSTSKSFELLSTMGGDSHSEPIGSTFCGYANVSGSPIRGLVSALKVGDKLSLDWTFRRITKHVLSAQVSVLIDRGNELLSFLMFARAIDTGSNRWSSTITVKAPEPATPPDTQIIEVA